MPVFGLPPSLRSNSPSSSSAPFPSPLSSNSTSLHHQPLTSTSYMTPSFFAPSCYVSNSSSLPPPPPPLTLSESDHLSPQPPYIPASPIHYPHTIVSAFTPLLSIKPFTPSPSTSFHPEEMSPPKYTPLEAFHQQENWTTLESCPLIPCPNLSAIPCINQPVQPSSTISSVSSPFAFPVPSPPSTRLSPLAWYPDRVDAPALPHSYSGGFSFNLHNPASHAATSECPFPGLWGELPPSNVPGSVQHMGYSKTPPAFDVFSESPYKPDHTPGEMTLEKFLNGTPSTTFQNSSGKGCQSPQLLPPLGQLPYPQVILSPSNPFATHLSAFSPQPPESSSIHGLKFKPQPGGISVPSFDWNTEDTRGKIVWPERVMNQGALDEFKHKSLEEHRWEIYSAGNLNGHQIVKGEADCASSANATAWLSKEKMSCPSKLQVAENQVPVPRGAVTEGSAIPTSLAKLGSPPIINVPGSVLPSCGIWINPLDSQLDSPTPGVSGFSGLGMSGGSSSSSQVAPFPVIRGSPLSQVAPFPVTSGSPWSQVAPFPVTGGSANLSKQVDCQGSHGGSSNVMSPAEGNIHGAAFPEGFPIFSHYQSLSPNTCSINSSSEQGNLGGTSALVPEKEQLPSTHPLIASLHNLSDVLGTFQSSHLSNRVLEQNCKVLQRTIYNLSQCLYAEQQELLQGLLLVGDFQKPRSNVPPLDSLDKQSGLQASQGQNRVIRPWVAVTEENEPSSEGFSKTMYKQTGPVPRCKPGYEEMTLSAIGKTVTDAPEGTKVYQQPTQRDQQESNMLLSEPEAQDVVVNMLRQEIGDIRTRLDESLKREEYLKASLEELTEDLQSEREESKGTIYLYGNMLKEAEEAAAKAKVESQQIAKKSLTLSVGNIPQESGGVMKGGEQNLEEVTDSAANEDVRGVQSRLAILRARPCWVEAESSLNNNTWTENLEESVFQGTSTNQPLNQYEIPKNQQGEKVDDSCRTSFSPHLPVRRVHTHACGGQELHKECRTLNKPTEFGPATDVPGIQQHTGKTTENLQICDIVLEHAPKMGDLNGKDETLPELLVPIQPKNTVAPLNTAQVTNITEDNQRASVEFRAALIQSRANCLNEGEITETMDRDGWGSLSGYFADFEKIQPAVSHDSTGEQGTGTAVKIASEAVAAKRAEEKGTVGFVDITTDQIVPAESLFVMSIDNGHTASNLDSKGKEMKSATTEECATSSRAEGEGSGERGAPLLDTAEDFGWEHVGVTSSTGEENALAKMNIGEPF